VLIKQLKLILPLKNLKLILINLIITKSITKY